MKNSYFGFFLWLIAYLVVTFSISFFTDDVTYVILWMANMTFIMSTVLMYIIYKTRNIHWFSGLDMKKVNKYTDKQKEDYAKAYFDVFLKSTILFIGYSIVGILFHFSFWVHLLLFIFEFVGVIVYATRIKLGE